MIVRDAVWGDIELPAWSADLIDTPQMQRLRRVRQLGFAFLVYPSAQHTRFEHSLGTAHLALRIAAQIGVADQPWGRAAVAAALLHDVAHAPFGHTFEDERPLLPRHDTVERMRAVLGGELGGCIARLPFAEQLQMMLMRAPEVPGWARDIVSGPLDADLLDYLRRDAVFTGLHHAYDARVFQLLTPLAEHLGVRLARHGRLRPDAYSEVLELFHARYFLTERVYLHHAKIAAGAMLAKAVERAREQGLGLDALMAHGDESLLWELQSGRYGDEAARLSGAVRARRLFKRAFVCGRRESGERAMEALWARYGGPEGRQHAERVIADAAGVASHQLALSCPPAPEFREMRVMCEFPQGVLPLDEQPDDDGLEVRVMAERYRNLWQISVFATEDATERVGAAASALFGLPNAHRAS